MSLPRLIPLALALATLGRAEGVPGPEVAFVDTLPPYHAQAAVAGTLRLWGHGSPKHDFMGKLVDAWIKGFTQVQPNVTFENHMYGTASAIGALYTGAGDIAILGEEISPAAARAFVRERHYAPTGFQIATGSLDVNYFDYAHIVYVNKDNPIRRLTLAQLEGIFGVDHRRAIHHHRAGDPSVPIASGYHDPVTETFVQLTRKRREESAFPATCFERETRVKPSLSLF